VRFAVFILAGLCGLFGLWLTVPTIGAVYTGTETGPDWTPTLRVLIVIGLVAAVGSVVGAVMSLRRLAPTWIVLTASAGGFLVGLGVFSLVGVPPAAVLVVAAVLAYQDRRRPGAPAGTP